MTLLSKRRGKIALMEPDAALQAKSEGSGLKYHERAGPNVRFIDSHLHLSDYVEVRQVLKYAKSSETLLVSASVGRESSMRTLKIATENGWLVRPFVGVHPSEVEKEESLEWLAGLAGKAAGIGEIGLDPKYSSAGERSTQMEVFVEQLRLAERMAKPVEVHSRGAEASCLEKLTSFVLGRVLLHWFQGEEFADLASEKGYFVSFGPGLLQSKKLQRIASRYDEGLILTESDGPVAFASMGGAGGPSTVPSVVFKLAELRRRSFEDMAEVVASNCEAFLRSPRKG